MTTNTKTSQAADPIALIHRYGAGEAAHSSFDIVNGTQGWDLRESDGHGSPWVVIATCPMFGTAQKLKNRLQACNSHAALVACRDALAVLLRHPVGVSTSAMEVAQARAALAVAKESQP
jgi:hypothetical protein